MEKRSYQVCTNCVMDTSDSKIVFDEKGMCDHCHNFYANIKPNWNPQGNPEELETLIQKIKKDGVGKKYDCLIGLSGGVDSSYVAYCAVKKWGLRPLIYAVDTCWNLEVANKNIEKIINCLGVDVHCTKSLARRLALNTMFLPFFLLKYKKVVAFVSFMLYC